MDREEIREMVHELDPKLDEKDDSFLSAMVLLSALEVGTDTDKIADFLSVPREDIVDRVMRLYDNGVFSDDAEHPDGVVRCEWMKEETGGIAFWLDVAVAEGFVERVKEEL